MNDQPLSPPVPLSDEDKLALLAAVDQLARTGLQAPMPEPENSAPVAGEIGSVVDSGTDR